MAAKILGEDGHGRFISDSETRPFQLAREGEAYQVLEVLIGDMVCLLDAATSKSSHHPGFLVRDCPREADMSGRLYREYLLLAGEAESQLSGNGAAPFQYIVTTTSAPPESIQETGTIVLELKAGNENDLLFRRRLTTSLPGIEGG